MEAGENGVSLRVDPRKGKDAAELSEMLVAWAEQAEKYRSGEINREDYDKWRYNYPKYDSVRLCESPVPAAQRCAGGGVQRPAEERLNSDKTKRAI